MATLRDKLFISDNRSHLLQIKKSYRLARHLQKQAGLNADKAKYHLDDVEPTGKRGYGSPEQFYAEICRQPAFRIEIPRRSRGNEMVPDPTEYEEMHTLPLGISFSSLIFQECIPDGIITLALDRKKFLYIKE